AGAAAGEAEERQEQGQRGQDTVSAAWGHVGTSFGGNGIGLTKGRTVRPAPATDDGRLVLAEGIAVVRVDQVLERAIGRRGRVTAAVHTRVGVDALVEHVDRAVAEQESHDPAVLSVKLQARAVARPRYPGRVDAVEPPAR